ncbi:MAG: mono/diheme cytochrome c family protein [Planctomycetota bacterium]|jgi:mono/diheme cytochrome c family protein
MLSFILTLGLIAPVAGQDAPTPALGLAEQLIGEHGCTACHQAPANAEAWLQTRNTPDLTHVGSRLGATWLRNYLLDPRGTKDWTSMPHLLGKFGPETRAEVADGLVAFLSTLGEGVQQQRVPMDVSELERGRALFHEIGCVACHAPQQESWEREASLLELLEAEAKGVELFDTGDDEEQPWMLPGTLAPPDLDLASFLPTKYGPDALTAFLLDPVAVRPSGHMPNMSLEEDEARAIALYLLRERAFAGEGMQKITGLHYELFEQPKGQSEPDFAVDLPVRTGSHPRPDISMERRDEHFGLRFRGMLQIPEDGSWSLSLRSDDGSRLVLDGRQVIDNWGNHAPQTKEVTLDLYAGPHSLGLTYFENSGGEELEMLWRGPGMDEFESIPASAFSHLSLVLEPLDGEQPELDRRQVRAGQGYFTGLGCAACHTTGVEEIDSQAGVGTALGKPLLELHGLEAAGCLEVGGPEPSSPRFRFDDEELTALRSWLAQPRDMSAAPTAEQRVARHLERMACTACHRRGDIGGVHPDRKDYFLADENAELGDESRYPPPLGGVGSKLRSAALAAVLLEGDGVRPYVKVRMPQFGSEGVGWMVESFAEADLSAAEAQAVEAGGELPAERVVMAQHLAGREGLGCIQCHDFAGVPSLGIRAADMARMHERLRPDWFKRLLRDPASVNMNTRMADLWVDGRSPIADVLDGDPDAQIDAIWDYLSLGWAMPYPDGLVAPDSDFALHATTGVECVSTFWRGAGPRVVAVGHPERLHYAFDVGHSRMHVAWRGAFFNARGTWQGRAGQLESAPGGAALMFAPGLLVARLDEASDPWPGGQGKEAGAQGLGRSYDDLGRPGFSYRLGDLELLESVEPSMRVGGVSMTRRVQVSAGSGVDPSGIYLRLAVGDRITALDGGGYAVKGAADYQVASINGAKAEIIELEGRMELRALVFLVASGDQFDGPPEGACSWEVQW